MLCRPDTTASRSAATLAAALAVIGLAASAAAQPVRPFVTRSADRLLEGDAEFRFVSFNVPNLHYVEDDLRFEQTSPWRLPDAFEITDALRTIDQMGGRVVRSYTLSVRKAGDDPAITRHVLDPNRFDEEAFRALDKVLQVAGETGVRVILPLVDQWSWWGGIAEYAAFRGKPAETFWTDPQVVADFKATIAFVLNRRNTFTGVLYRDDPSVLAWETGNELDNPVAWSHEIAAYIKSIDRNHLVIDGYHAGLKGLRPESIDDPDVDILTTHNYPDFPVPVVEAAARARALLAGRKAYIVGEFGFMPTATVRVLLEQVVADGTSGALAWSLRVHDRNGGFYWHSEPAGGGIYKAYHWPGFPSGDAYDETALLALMREKAFAIRGMAAPPPPTPAPPVLLPIQSAHAIGWQGSAGARSYDVERAEAPGGPWVLAGAGVDDTAVQYRPLFEDRFAEAGRRYYYRVRARNASGVSAPSNVVGPVGVKAAALVDDLRDLTRVFDHADVTIVAGGARRTKEDVHRLRGTPGSRVTYRAREPIGTASVDAFFPGEIVDFTIESSADGFTWSPAAAARADYFAGAGEYGYHKPVRFSVAGLPPGHMFLRLTFGVEAEIARVEVEGR